LFVLALGGVYVYETQKPATPAVSGIISTTLVNTDSRIYVDENLGIQIVIPKSWEVKTDVIELWPENNLA
jgi:hypothetical protein